MIFIINTLSSISHLRYACQSFSRVSGKYWLTFLSTRVSLFRKEVLPAADIISVTLIPTARVKFVLVLRRALLKEILSRF